MTCLCDQIYFVDKTWQLFNWKINNNNKQRRQQQQKQILSTNNYRDCSNVSISNLETCYASTFSTIEHTHTHTSYMHVCGCGCLLLMTCSLSLFCNWTLLHTFEFGFIQALTLFSARLNSLSTKKDHKFQWNGDSASAFRII